MHENAKLTFSIENPVTHFFDYCDYWGPGHAIFTTLSWFLYKPFIIPKIMVPTPATNITAVIGVAKRMQMVIIIAANF